MWKYLFGLMLLTNTTMAQQSLDFASWDILQRELRILYLGGLIDGFLAFSDNKKAIEHYRNCIDKSNMDIWKLEDNIKLYIKNHPQFSGNPLSNGMINYLNERCGKPPG